MDDVLAMAREGARVVAGGAIPRLHGATMFERRQHFLKEYDWIRTGLMFEPRGHDMMSGSILYPATRPDCDIAILFIETSGCLPMCGHGTIGVATVLVETGMVAVTEPDFGSDVVVAADFSSTSVIAPAMAKLPVKA